MTVYFFNLPFHVTGQGSHMKPLAFNASDFCAMKVVVRCFTSSKLGLPRQTCGAQSVFDLARRGVGNREKCMQATKITKWLQTDRIDTYELRREVTHDCGAFLQINKCVSPYNEQCGVISFISFPYCV